MQIKHFIFCVDLEINVLFFLLKYFNVKFHQ